MYDIGKILASLTVGLERDSEQEDGRVPPNFENLFPLLFQMRRERG